VLRSTAPTAIRALAGFGDELPKKYDLSSLRVLGTVGEPINPAAWQWYYKVAWRHLAPAPVSVGDACFEHIPVEVNGEYPRLVRISILTPPT